MISFWSHVSKAFNSHLSDIRAAVGERNRKTMSSVWPEAGKATSMKIRQLGDKPQQGPRPWSDHRRRAGSAYWHSQGTLKIAWASHREVLEKMLKAPVPTPTSMVKHPLLQHSLKEQLLN